MNKIFSTVKLLLDEPEHIRILATTAKDNYLVLTDQYYPGWQAKVDGQPSPIFPANAIFRAVFVPAGQHEIDFQYLPKSLLNGLFCAAIAVIVLLTLLIGSRFVVAKSTSTVEILP